MNSLFTILEKLKLDIKTDFPALLSSSGVDNFAKYKIGTSRNAEEMGFFIYFDNDGFDKEQNKLSLILQMQLYKKEELEGAKYRDVLREYILDYDTNLIGMDILEKIEIISWGLERTATTFYVAMVTFSESIDSCS